MQNNAAPIHPHPPYIRFRGCLQRPLCSTVSISPLGRGGGLLISWNKVSGYQQRDDGMEIIGISRILISSKGHEMSFLAAVIKVTINKSVGKYRNIIHPLLHP